MRTLKAGPLGGRAGRDARDPGRRRAEAARAGVGQSARGPRSSSSTAGRSATSAGRSRSAASSPPAIRIVTFDIRGHGLSEKPSGPEHYADGRLWADDVAAVIEQTGLERPVLVAWSYGGYIVTDYPPRVRRRRRSAGDRPRRQRAVILRPPTFDHIGPGLLENATGHVRSDLAREHRRHPPLPAPPARRSRSTSDDWTRRWAGTWSCPPEVRGALIAREIDGSDVLSRITVPVLVTHGREDAIVLPVDGGAHPRALCEPAAGVLVRRRRAHAVLGGAGAVRPRAGRVRCARVSRAKHSRSSR